MGNASRKLGLFGLVAVVVSSMVGSGVYSLPQNMAAAAGVDAIIIAWLITGLGMFFIADTFRLLATAKPNLNYGFYSYAKEAFGDKVSFIVFWGYWLYNAFANVAFTVIVMETLNYFFPPYFQGGNNLNSLILSSVMVWAYIALIWRGIQTAALVNLVGTIVKLIPILFFILVMIAAFNFKGIEFEFFGKLPLAEWKIGSILGQVKGTMLVTLWAFIGIETAVALSHRAQKRKDVTYATFIGFGLCLVTYILITILPFGIMTRGELTALHNPSTAGVLAKVLGRPGALIMNIGLIISVAFAFLSWVIICVETPFVAAKEGIFPKQLTKENKAGVPSNATIVTGLVMQFSLLLAFFSNNAWNIMICIAGVMVLPVYLVTALCLFKARKADNLPVSRFRICATAVVAILYSLWLIYAADIKYLLMASAFFVVGIPVYLVAKKQRKHVKVS